MNDKELDDLLNSLDLPDDESVKLETRVRLGGMQQKGKSNLSKWAKENPKVYKESTSNGGKLGGNVSKQLGLGVHGLNDEQRKLNAVKGNLSRKTKGHPPTKPILVFKDNNFTKEYKSISECARDMNLYKGNINKVLKGKYKQHKGYVFRYKP